MPWYLENEVSTLLISLHHTNENVFVYFYSNLKENSTTFSFLIWEKPNIYNRFILEKFAFVQWNIMNINQIVEANSKCFYKYVE